MIKNLLNNYTICSLGYNCFIKKYIDTIKPNHTNFFDNIGTPAWAINKLIINNFENIFDEKEYKHLIISKQIKLSKKYNNRIFRILKEEYITNTKYYIRFVHDLKINYTKEEFNLFKEKYERRIVRFNNLLNNENNILFIRLNELMKNRVIYNYEYYVKSELENLIELNKILKNKYPNINFYILYFCNNYDNIYDDINNIIIINYQDELSWENCVDKFNILFTKNYEFINNILNKNNIN